MSVADGFSRQRPDGPKAPVQVPKFTSTFNEKQSQTARRKPPSKSNFGLKSDFVTSKPVPAASMNNPKSQNLKQLTVPAFVTHTAEKEKKFVPPTRLQPLPDARTLTKGETSAMAPLPPPPLLPTPPKHTVTLKNIPAPMIFAPKETSIEASLRTISTTNIALATDLLTDSGTAELAHIFLHDQHPNIAASNKHPQPDWNVGMSPKKDVKSIKGKGKEPKFLKGGLAARSSELLAQSRTSLVLWQTEMELQLSSSTFRSNADLRLRILKIIDQPVGPKSSSPRSSRKPVSSSSAVSIGAALCRIVNTSISYPHQEELCHLVVLSFPTVAPPRVRGRNGIYIRNPEDFIVGHELHVWEPWHEVPICPTHSSVSSNDVVVPGAQSDCELRELAAAPFPSLPSTYPRTLSSKVAEEGFSTSNIVLLCSRFMIVP
ncbi:hypothetical protein C0992_011961 [Termitomyces sp. T32_za158]|nr:hypothetical protein C0992_011961 [Termitomyces sp. T32_za158]